MECLHSVASAIDEDVDRTRYGIALELALDDGRKAIEGPAKICNARDEEDVGLRPGTQHAFARTSSRRRRVSSSKPRETRIAQRSLTRISRLSEFPAFDCTRTGTNRDRDWLFASSNFPTLRRQLSFHWLSPYVGVLMPGTLFL